MALKGGFSFCGVDIDSLELTYVPEMSNTYSPFEGAGFNTSTLVDGTTDGGFFYGTTLKPKEFTLRCIFEKKDIREGLPNRIDNLFRRGRTGRLVFKQREWAWYSATVTDNPDYSKLTNYMNGFVTIKLTAYYPYSRGIGLYFDSSVSEATERQWDATHDEKAWKKWIRPGRYSETYLKYVHENTGYIEKTRMPSVSGVQFDSDETNLLLYNPGNEMTKTAVKIQGNLTDGVEIINKTTGQKCELSGVNTSGYLLITDGLNGKTVLCDIGTLKTQPGYLYHHGGFIDLAPYESILRGVSITKTDARGYISTHPDKATFDQSFIGKWIMADGIQMKIVNVTDEGELVTDRENEIEKDSVIECDIVGCVNEITVRKKSDGVTINSFDIDYKPAFR